MIQIVLETSNNGLFHGCEVKGHACYAPEGFDIVCASVTCLVRTALELLENQTSLKIKTDIQNRGSLAFSVLSYQKDDESFLKYLMDFLTIGIKRISVDYPKYVLLRVIKQ